MSHRYFVSRDVDGTISHLVRICETETALWGEYYRAGKWTKDSAVMAYLGDGTPGHMVSEEEAMAIVREVDARQIGSGLDSASGVHADSRSAENYPQRGDRSDTAQLAAEESAILQRLIREQAAREQVPIANRAIVSEFEKYEFPIGLDDAGEPFDSYADNANE